MSLRIVIFISSLFAILNAADSSVVKERTFFEYIDEKQKNISEGVVGLFNDIDEGLSDWINSENDMLYDDKTKREREDINRFDNFFKEKSYLQESEASYIRIRLSTLFQTKESASFSPKLKAQIPLLRSEKDFQIFFDDVDEDEREDFLPSKESGKDMGVSFFAPMYKDIKSKYSIGLRGISTYVSARYSKDFKMQNWLIKPVQQFKYSTKYDFSEETDLHFDRKLDEDSIFRTTLHRKTQSFVDGFDYALAFTYYMTPSSRNGYSISQEFWGNSEYTSDGSREKFSGISDYSTSFALRRNIFRKWIAYEVKPSVSFHREHDYEANYKLRFYIDFYFGNIN